MSNSEWSLAQINEANKRAAEYAKRENVARAECQRLQFALDEANERIRVLEALDRCAEQWFLNERFER